MRGNIALAGFYWTAAEWEALDPPARAQLLGAADARRADAEPDDAYLAYELVLGEPWRVARAA
jgi:hypothetical protein